MKTYRSRSMKWIEAFLEGLKENEADQEERGLPWHMFPCKRRILDQFDEHVKSNGQIQFFIVFGDSSECSYSVYHADNLVKKEFDLLPGPLTELRVHLESTRSGSINVEWDFEDLGYPYHFLVEYQLKRSSDRSWIQQKTTKPGETIATIPFESGSPMEIRVAADSCIGLGEFSHVLDTQSAVGGDYSTDSQLSASKRKRFN